MGRCIEKIGHSCGTTDALQVFEGEDGTVNGFCFACKTHVAHPYGEPKKLEDLDVDLSRVKSPEELQEELEEISLYPVVDIPIKRLRASSLDYFGVRVALSEKDGKTPEILCYPYYKKGVLSGYKMKVLENKRIWSIGDCKGVDFFGFEQALQKGARRLIITEGEDDAIALHRIIEMYSNPKYKNYTAVVSLPSGAAQAKDIISRRYEELRKTFSEIILCFDMDEPGRKATEEVSIACPGVQTMDIPCKDANECLIEGKGKALYNCLFSTVKAKNSRLVRAGDIFDEAGESPTYGELSWPWSHINKETRGIKYGQTIYLGAGVKMGKSEVVNAMAAHFIHNHNIKVLMAKPEEDNKHTVKLIAGKIAGKIFHDPDKEYDRESYESTRETISDSVFMLDIYQHLGWETLKQDILSAVVDEGVKAIFIDPITNLTVGMSSAEANTKLEEIATELSSMAKDLNIVIFIFCHLKAHDGNISRDVREKKYRDGVYIGLGNCPHEFGGDVYSNQFAGSRAMMRSCHMMVGIEGNKDPEIPLETRCIRHLKVLEDRNYGTAGVFPIYWNPNTSLFKEI